MASVESPPTDHGQGYPRITKSSPVRDLGPAGLDYERCAALHNELLRRGVEGSGREMPPSPQSYWEAAAPSGEVTSLLQPPVVEFLKRAHGESPLLTERGALFHYLRGLAEPSRMVDVLNQDTMKASFIADYNDTPGVCALPYAWMPLEVTLDAYLQMIDDRKVEAVPDDRIYDLADNFDSTWVIPGYPKVLDRST
ncbi:hypothetical protein BDV10DRAFT_189272 [Aspergillus recurvatus]